ncbi:MAG: hypothetical protein JWO14_3685 [Solirubrobacterales bacterium]|nr:hypothetical protein [Solirubrobacterales bacterium]
MTALRAYALALAACVVIEGFIYYGLVGLGASEDVMVELEMIWLCITVFLTLIVGDHFDHGGDER